MWVIMSPPGGRHAKDGENERLPSLVVAKRRATGTGPVEAFTV